MTSIDTTDCICPIYNFIDSDDIFKSVGVEKSTLPFSPIFPDVVPIPSYTSP